MLQAKSYLALCVIAALFVVAQCGRVDEAELYKFEAGPQRRNACINSCKADGLEISGYLEERCSCSAPWGRFNTEKLRVEEALKDNRKGACNKYCMSEGGKMDEYQGVKCFCG